MSEGSQFRHYDTWTADAGQATSVLYGARPVSLYVDDYSDVGCALVLLEGTTIGDQHRGVGSRASRWAVVSADGRAEPRQLRCPEQYGRGSRLEEMTSPKVVGLHISHDGTLPLVNRSRGMRTVRLSLLVAVMAAVYLGALGVENIASQSPMPEVNDDVPSPAVPVLATPHYAG